MRDTPISNLFELLANRCLVPRLNTHQVYGAVWSVTVVTYPVSPTLVMSFTALLGEITGSGLNLLLVVRFLGHLMSRMLVGVLVRFDVSLLQRVGLGPVVTAVLQPFYI